MRSFWLSWTLLVVAYCTYGQRLHSSEVKEWVWLGSLAFITFKAGLLTVLWKPSRKIILMGFQSDVGYSIMVLVLASLAVLAVVQFPAFAYFVVLVAAALLVRVDCQIEKMSSNTAFLALLLLPAIGLGLSWIPTLLHLGARH